MSFSDLLDDEYKSHAGRRGEIQRWLSTGDPSLLLSAAHRPDGCELHAAVLNRLEGMPPGLLAELANLYFCHEIFHRKLALVSRSMDQSEVEKVERALASDGEFTRWESRLLHAIYAVKIGGLGPKALA